MLEEGKSQWNNQFGTSVSCPKQTRASLHPIRHHRSLCQFFVSLAELMRSTEKTRISPPNKKPHLLFAARLTSVVRSAYCNRNCSVTVRCIGTALPSSVAG